MSQEKLIDRYEPLDSILGLYKRFGQSSTLIKHIFRFISKNIKVKKQDRRLLFECMFNQQQEKEKKIKIFIASVASDLDLVEQENLIEQLIIQTKTQINRIDDDHQALVHANYLNNRIYKQINI